MRVNSISSFKPFSNYLNKARNLPFRGLGIYEDNNKEHTPTKEDLIEIDKINKKRGTEIRFLEPNRLFKVFEIYDSPHRESRQPGWYLNYYHANKGANGWFCILTKDDLKNLSDDSPLYRFQYVQDLKNSKSGEEFYTSLKHKIFEKKIKDIDDKIVLNHILSDNTDVYEGHQLLDGINSAEGRYTPLIKTLDSGGEKTLFWGDFDVFLHQNFSSTNKVMKDGKLPSIIARRAKEWDVPEKYIKKDIEMNIKYNSISGYFMNLNAPKNIQDRLYYKYYLKNIKNDIDVTDEQIQKCKKINNVYGTKIILSSDTRNLDKSLDFIEKEFAAWKKASNWEAKMPKILDLNYAYKDWYKHTVGYADRKAKIGLPGPLYSNIRNTLRHELVHVNEAPSHDYLLFEDIKEGKYQDEFWQAGIKNRRHITYAHTNNSEYIAVAAEGDMKKYSPEFKGVLIKLGMPEWAFDLESIDEQK